MRDDADKTRGWSGLLLRDNDGHSLIEMMIIVGVLSILLAVGTLTFREYSARYHIEAQTGLLLSELQKARADAICQRRGTRVKVYADRFEVYSSQVDGAGVGPRETHQLRYPVIWRPNDLTEGIDFNEGGISYDIGSICVETGGPASVDSVVISGIRLSVGKRNQGYDCISDNIEHK